MEPGGLPWGRAESDKRLSGSSGSHVQASEEASRPLTCQDTALTTAVSSVWGTIHGRGGSRNGWTLGGWSGQPWPALNSNPQFSQNKTNSSVKKSNMIPQRQFAHALMMVWVWGLELWMGTPKLQSWSLTHRAEALPGAFPQLELQIAVTWDFPVLFESGCQRIQLGEYVLLLSFAVSISLFFKC